MKLYLSSYRVPAPEDLFSLIGKEPAEIKMALIPNAKDYYAVRARDFKIKETVTYMKDIGITADVVDLRSHHTESILESALEPYDLVWVMGGNTFCLMQEIKRSGFDKVLGRLVEKGLVYGGESAGAVVAGPSLEGVELADEPAFAEEIVWQGMKLIPEYVIPHAGSVQYGAATEEIMSMHTGKPLISLTDAQAYIVNEEECRIVG